jgi:hypothetical protein
MPVRGAICLMGLCQTLACASPESEDTPRGRGAAAVAPATPLDHAQVARALSRSPRDLRTHVLGDGTQFVEVVSGFQHATVVVATDAGVESHCVTSADEARKLLEGRTQ